MATLSSILTVFCALIGLAKLARLAGRYLAKQFDGAGVKVKPFSCAPCLAFWLMLFSGLTLPPALPRGLAVLTFYGVALLVGAGLNYLYERNKVTILP